MLDIETCVRLRDAGWPQDLEAGDWFWWAPITDEPQSNLPMLASQPHAAEVYAVRIPSLAQLVTAMGPELTCLFALVSRKGDLIGYEIGLRSHPFRDIPLRAIDADYAFAKGWLSLRRSKKDDA